MIKILKTFSFLAIFFLSIFSGLLITNAGESGNILRNQDKSADNLKLCTGGERMDSSGKTFKCTIDTGIKDVQKVNGIEKKKSFFEYAQDVLGYVLGFVYIIAVIYIIYAGFLLLMGTGDIIASGKAKSNIIYVLVGITVIYLANSIVVWLVTNVLGTEIK